MPRGSAPNRGRASDHGTRKWRSPPWRRGSIASSAASALWTHIGSGHLLPSLAAQNPWRRMSNGTDDLQLFTEWQPLVDTSSLRYFATGRSTCQPPASQPGGVGCGEVSLTGILAADPSCGVDDDVEPLAVSVDLRL